MMQSVAAAPPLSAPRPVWGLVRPLPLLNWRRLALIGSATAVVFLPFLQPTGPGNSSPVDVFIGLAIGATICWALSDRLTIRVPYVRPIALMAFAGAVAALFSSYPGIGLLTVLQDFVLVAWAAALVNVCRDAHAMSVVMRCWAYSSVVWALLMVGGAITGIDALSGESAREGTRAYITFGDPNMAAGYYCSSIMVIWASRTPRARLARWLAQATLVAAIVFTGSNGFSLATAAAAVTAMVIGLRRRHGVMPALTLLCALALGVGLVASQVDVQAVVQDAAASAPIVSNYVGRVIQSGAGRDTLLQETLALADQGGLLGIGPGAVKETLQATQASYEFEAHSDVTASIAERGLLGGVGLLLLVVTIMFRGRQALGRLRPAYAAVVRSPGALIGGLVAYGITTNIYEIIHFRYVWALLALVAALGIWGREPAT